MARRISTQKRLPYRDFKYESLLVSLFVNRLLKAGKKQLTRRIIYSALVLIQQRLSQNPILILEKAVNNASPRIELTSKFLSGVTYQIPTKLTRFRSTNFAVCWLIQEAKKRSEKNMVLNLANELLDASKGMGGAVKKRDEEHKMVEANKAFATYE
uniref:Ribosomal protein S7 n=1 Tax=Spumella sp. Baekdong012001B8 TaxID=2782410 RepID=A0A7S6PV81_9STRA|nr:ribosomal protein S7 [Spumella sp. Baekdong012001B8]